MRYIFLLLLIPGYVLAAEKDFQSPGALSAREEFVSNIDSYIAKLEKLHQFNIDLFKEKGDQKYMDEALALQKEIRQVKNLKIAWENRNNPTNIISREGLRYPNLNSGDLVLQYNDKTLNLKPYKVKEAYLSIGLVGCCWSPSALMENKFTKNPSFFPDRQFLSILLAVRNDDSRSRRLLVPSFSLIGPKGTIVDPIQEEQARFVISLNGKDLEILNTQSWAGEVETNSIELLLVVFEAKPDKYRLALTGFHGTDKTVEIPLLPKKLEESKLEF